MTITYADKHIWQKEVGADIYSSLGNNNTSKLKRLTSELVNFKINYAIEPLSIEHLDWFIPIYNAHVASKKHPHIFDIFETTIGKIELKFPYYILFILEENKPIGGIIFTERENKISIAYRTFPNDWQKHTVACSPALYAEYLIAVYAQEIKRHLLFMVKTVIHTELIQA